jgi:hypothetical protein
MHELLPLWQAVEADRSEVLQENYDKPLFILIIVKNSVINKKNKYKYGIVHILHLITESK